MQGEEDKLSVDVHIYKVIITGEEKDSVVMCFCDVLLTRKKWIGEHKL